jgi:hypothetical protein
MTRTIPTEAERLQQQRAGLYESFVPFPQTRGSMARVDWKALGKAVTRRRVSLGYRTIVAFAPVVELSTRLLGDLEAGKRASYDPATLARIERALQWPPGAVDVLLEGGDEPSTNVTYDYRGWDSQPPSVRVGDAVISKTPQGGVRIDRADDPDPLPAKLERLTFHARTLSPEDLRQLGVLIQTAIEWAASRTGTPEVPGDPADFQRATAAADRAAVEHAKRQPVPPMSDRRRTAEAQQ